MPIQKHHKIIFGGFTSVIIIFMIFSGVLLNTILTKQNLNYNALDSRITELQADTQGKLNELTQSIVDIRQSVTTLDTSLKSEINLLKASAGEDFSGIIEDSVKFVVTIRTDISQGTGFIIDDDGYIVTNAHILVGGSRIEALTYEQEVLEAVFIGYDGELDIALLKISGNYDEAILADSDDVQIGEKVIAIGNPLGLQFSVSEGIVSGIHRKGANGLDIYIQTDAALNPGNSGGPLINKEGEVIGINNFKIGIGENLGFALESNYIKEAVNDIAWENLNETLI